MSGAVTAAAIAGVVGTAYSIYSGEKQSKQARSAQRDAENRARKQEEQAEQDTNRARSNTPDTAALLQQAASPGGASTMLTGAQGVDPNQLNLGKTNLLGG